MKVLIEKGIQAAKAGDASTALGAVEPAQPLTRRLAQRRPDSARAQYLLAATCGELNLGPQAQAAIIAAAALAPDDPGIGVLYASLDADARRCEAAASIAASPSRNQVSRPLYRTARARWRRYEREMAPVQAALAPFVVAFGYDAAD